MDYAVLQELAKKYNIKYHRVGRKELENAVKRYEAINDIPSSFPTQPVEPTPPTESTVETAPTQPASSEQSTQEPAKPSTEEADKAPEKKATLAVAQEVQTPVQTQVEEPKEGDNAAVVLKGSHEVRRYTAEIHGENYATLARGFAAKNKLKVVFVNNAPVKRCENCGAVQK